jgi:hypothetical protein
MTPASVSAALPAPPPPPVLPPFDALASQQVRLAPGLHELARGDATGSAPLPKVTRDTCVRVAYAATAPVTVSLVAHDGSVLASAPAAKEGSLELRGPVCFHPDAEPRVVVGGDAGLVRYVVWGAP